MEFYETNNKLRYDDWEVDTYKVKKKRDMVWFVKTSNMTLRWPSTSSIEHAVNKMISTVLDTTILQIVFTCQQLTGH